MKREQMKKRLTIRLPAQLEKLIREEAIRRGTTINNLMVSILEEKFPH